MKNLKYLIMSALLMGFGIGAAAQDGSKADVETFKAMYNSKPADLAKQMKNYYNKNKKNPENLVAFGRFLFEQKDTANARQAADKAIAAAKQTAAAAPAYVLKGDIAALGEDGGAAAAMYDQAIYWNPKDPEAYRKYAIIYRRVSLQGSISKLEELRSQVPDYPVDAIMAHIYYLSLQYASAAQTYAKIPESKLSRLDWIEYAYSTFSSKKYEEAFNICQRGLAAVPNNATLTRIAMFSAVEVKKNAEARQLAETMFNKIDKDSIKITDKDYMYYGRALAADSLFQEALEQYSKGLTVNGEAETNNHADIHEYMADAYEGMKDYPNAITEHLRSMELLPEVTALDYSGTGRLYMQYARTLEGEQQIEAYKKAEQVYMETIQKFPGQDDEYCYYQMARLNVNLDPEMQDTKAKEYFEKVIELVSAHETPRASDKSRLESSYRFLLGYYGTQKDKENQLIYAKKIQEIAPSETIDQLVESLEKSLAQ